MTCELIIVCRFVMVKTIMPAVKSKPDKTVNRRRDGTEVFHMHE